MDEGKQVMRSQGEPAGRPICVAAPLFINGVVEEKDGMYYASVGDSCNSANM